MKSQITTIQYLVFVVTLLMTSLSATASLIQSQVLAFNQSSQGFGDISGVHENSLSSAQFYASYPDGGFYRGQTTTGFGWAGGSASSEIAYGGVRLLSTFTLDDIIITYTGSGTADMHVPGQLHITYSANFASHLNGNSTFSLGATGSGISYQGKTLYAGGAAPLSGIWSLDGLFAVNSNLTLTIHSALSISNTLPEVQSAVRSSSGGFTTVLGGSPVFNLPEFYSANSADGTIVNNMYVGFNPLASNGPVGVSAPGTLFLFISGMFALLMNQRRLLGIA
jgi:hypothetical protein